MRGDGNTFAGRTALDLEPDPEEAVETARARSTRKEKSVYLSVFVPVNNEERNIPILFNELTEVLSGMGRSYEILFIDDGSTDGSFETLRQLRRKDRRLKILRFTRNYGITAAISAAFDFSSGQILIGIDGDLEQDPRDIPKLVAKLEEGYDVVSGWRKDKWMNSLTGILFRRVPTEVANFLVRRLTGIKLRDCSSTLKAYRADLIKQVRLYGEMHRFIPVAAHFLGARITEVPINFRPRRHGRTHYGISRTIKVFLDLILLKFLQEYSTRPIQIFGLLGLLCGAFGFPALAYLIFLRLVKLQAIADRPLLILSVLSIMLSVQFIMMGLLGELMTRTYHESQNKPIYTVRERWL